jgi:hypothetical protein
VRGKVALTVPLPPWYPEGPYCLSATIANETWQVYDAAKVDIGPVTGAAPPPAGPAPGSTPAETAGPFVIIAEAGAWFWIVLALAAGGVALALRAARRRRGDEP